MISGSDGPFVGDILNDIFECVFVFAGVVFASSHKVKKTGNTDIYFFFVGETACFWRKFTFSQ